MALARKETVNPQKSGVYHCWSRCVRRAFLCGSDLLTGKNFDHRKFWVENRLRELVDIFAIEVLSYAIMDNHQHLVVRNNPDLTSAWSSDEVAIRWRRLFPRNRDYNGTPEDPSQKDVAEITNNPTLVETLRVRLADLSWFMRCLNEYIAKRANIEDDVTGRFWEGRFKCTRLDGDAAVLSGMAYVDLNPIRARKAASLQDSKFTSIAKRLATTINHAPVMYSKTASHLTSNSVTTKQISPLSQDWLCPLETVFSKNSGITLRDYLFVLTDTANTISGKQGNISHKIKPTLRKASINPDTWTLTSSNFRKLFPRVAGSARLMKKAATNSGKAWFKGTSFAHTCFLL